MGFRGRIKRLEEAAGGEGECPRCGGGGDAGNQTYELVFIDPGGAEDGEESCKECGRPIHIVLTWGDEK